MGKNAHDQRKIIDLLAGLYEEIYPLELEFHLFVGNGDYRPRIDYFQDAIRAFTRADAAEREDGGRLSLEFLAYDVSALRYLQAQPLASLNPNHAPLSPHTHVAVRSSIPKNPPKKASRAQRMALSELYARYAVLFAALLKPLADQDYRDRIEEMDEQVETLCNILHSVEALGAEKTSHQAVQSALKHCEDKEVEKLVKELLEKKNYKQPQKLTKSLQGINAKVKQTDQAISQVEAAHMQYVTAQLGLFEQAKESVKALASQGLNLAGRFVEGASVDTQRGRSR